MGRSYARRTAETRPERRRKEERVRFTFVHAADVHLDSPLHGLERYPAGLADKVRAATREAFSNLVDACIAERAAFLLLAGDLYDGQWDDYRTGLFLIEQLARLGREGIAVVLLRGNHDAASVLTKSLRWPEGVHELATEAAETVRLEPWNVAVHGQGFARRDVRDDLARGYPEPEPGALNVGLLHTALAGRKGHETYAPTTESTLVGKGYDYWALGHVHGREEVRRGDAGGPWIVFPGNLQGRYARETGEKGATFVTVEDGRITHVEHRALDVVRWSHVVADVAEAQGPDDAIELAREALGRAMDAAGGRLLAARVSLVGASPAHEALAADLERWSTEVLAAGLGAGACIEQVRVETRSRVDLEALAREDGPLADVLSVLGELRAPGERQTQMAQSLADVRARLPPELRAEGAEDEGEDVLALSGLVGDVEALLVARLTALAEERGR
jgi:DNA repair exonuclease SbcCD nuclease subunit